MTSCRGAWPILCGALLAAGLGAVSSADAPAPTIWGAVAPSVERTTVVTAPAGGRGILLLGDPLIVRDASDVSDTGPAHDRLAGLAARSGRVVGAAVIAPAGQAEGAPRLWLTLIAPDGSTLLRSAAALPVPSIGGVMSVRLGTPIPLDTVTIAGTRVGIAAIGDADGAIPLLGERGAALVLLTGGPVNRAQVERFAGAARAGRVALLIAGRCAGTPGCVAAAAVDADGRIEWEPTRDHGFAVARRWSPDSAAGLPAIVPQPSRYDYTPAIAALGRTLFFDTRIAGRRSVACAICHDPARGFADGRSLSAGAHGRSTRRNAISLLNVAFRPTLRWDGYPTSLENFVKYPLSGSAEMDAHDLDRVRDRVARSRAYRARFVAAFGPGGIDFERVERALAAYMRTLVSGDAPFDRAMAGDGRAAMPEAAWRGYALFTGRAGCSGCHAYSAVAPFFSDAEVHNTGLGWDAASRRYGDVGAGAIGAARLAGAFRTPSLRDVALTAPYMHDGSIATLGGVIDYFDRGGGDGPGRDPALRPLHLSTRDKQDLEAFLIALTGDCPMCRKQTAGDRSIN